MNVIHILLIKVKPETTDQQLQEALAALAGLQQKIPGILDVQIHPSLQGGKQGEDYTHLAAFTFENEERFAAYGPHPTHQTFIREFVPRFSEVLAFDYLQDQRTI